MTPARSDAMRSPHALIAEDEPLLAEALAAELAALWPGLRLLPAATNGPQALRRLLEERPDIAFLDIRMPGMSGIEVARALAEDWPDDGTRPPLLVFVTAYDEFALAAFEHAAIDYVLKPVRADRLARTVERLRERLAHGAGDASIEALVERLRAIAAAGGTAPGIAPGIAPRIAPGAASGIAPEAAPAARGPAPLAPVTCAPSAAEPLRWLRAGLGDAVRIVPVEEIAVLQADDKYVSVLTREGESLIREPLRQLLPRLDAQRFVQVHRSTIVNLGFVDRAVRDDAGRLRLLLRGLDRQVAVSRLYAHLFRAM